MAKKAKTKRKTIQQKFWYEFTQGQFSRLYILLSLLAVVSFIYFARNAYVGSDKHRFDQAEASISKIADSITQEVRKPEDKDTQKQCSYVSRKEGNGPRSCHILTTLLYSNISNQEADELTHNVTQMKLTNGAVFIPEGISQLKSFTEINESAAERNTTSYTDTSSKMKCHISFSREQPYGTKFYAYGHTALTNNLYVGISCSGPARAEHYPVN